VVRQAEGERQTHSPSLLFLEFGVNALRDFPQLADEDVCRLLKHETEACALTR